MFGIGGFELFIILVFGFLIFGPDKLPEIAKTVGKGIARFRDAQQEMNETLGGEKIFDPNNPDEPFKDPVEMLDKLAQRQEEKRNAAKAGPGGKAATAASSAADASSTGPAATTASSSGGARSTSGAHQESFTERKARYERERAARKAAEREAAENAAAESAHPADDASLEKSAAASRASDSAGVAEASAPSAVDAVGTGDEARHSLSSGVATAGATAGGAGRVSRLAGQAEGDDA